MESLSKGLSIHDIIKRLGTNFEEVPIIGGSSKYLSPVSLLYEVDGNRRRWDAVESHSSIGVILYHRERNAFLLVRQFRPAVYAVEVRAAAAALRPIPPLTSGFTFELCAGLLDKPELTLEEVTSEEIEEEVGYKVPASQIRFVSNSVANAGTGGSLHYMFYAEVDESMKIPGSGGGLADHGELIEVLSLPLEATEAFILDPAQKKSPGVQFGLLWAKHNAIGK